MELRDMVRISGGKGSAPKIGDMFFGSTDANNEYLQTGNDRFMKLFCSNPSFDVNKVLDGSVSFICGNKGTGKTMFLRFAELKAKERACPTVFVKYKRQITETDKKLLRQAANGTEERVYDGESRATAASIDYVLGWQLYLIKVIISMIRNSENSAFAKESDEWQHLVSLIDDMYGSPSSRLSNRLIPRLSKGQVTINLKLVKLVLGYEPNCKNDNYKVSFTELAECIVQLYSALPCRCEANPAFVFIDEIELAYGQKKEYERNIALVRDLILAVTYLNDVARENRFPIRIVLALRNEVFRSVKNTGYELNKPIEDYGTQIDWRATTGDVKDNPLLRIVEKRIIHNVPSLESTPSLVWSYYFPKSVDGIPIENYILNQTWNKPRDIVRLLTTLKKHCKDQETFDEGAFYRIRDEYSKRAWSEIEEELRTIYSVRRVEGMEKILSGITCPFCMEDLSQKIEREANMFACVEELRNEMRTTELIEAMFKFGIIGNVSNNSKETGKSRFSAYGEEAPDFFGSFTIHYPLRKMFDVRGG